MLFPANVLVIKGEMSISWARNITRPGYFGRVSWV